MSERSPFVVSADWLQERLRAPGISIVDGSWYLPAQGRDGKREYQAAHIPGAVFFDHDLIVNPRSDLPHALPSPSDFERHVSAMGISQTDTIVVYDGPCFFSAPRTWWLFRIMGATEVYVLDGGFDSWRAEGRPVTDEPTKIAPCVFKTDFDPSRVASLEDMRRYTETGESQMADARPPGRFAGVDPEPRPGVRPGYIPGACNVHWATLSRDGRLLPLDELRKVLEEAGLDLDRPVATSCGSGITAAVISLALESLGHRDHKLYDGSWTEWGGRDDTPVATGNA